MNTLKSNFLELVIEDLPIIRPIKEFIHLNLLLPYQKMPFWEAISLISQKLDAFAIPSMQFFREKMQNDAQFKAQILKKIDAINDTKKSNAILDQIHNVNYQFIQHDIRFGQLHNHWNTYIGVDVMRLADSMLIRWLGMFLDQGIATWKMPGSDTKSFYHCIRDLILESWIRPTPFKKEYLNTLFPQSSEEAISEHLNFLCPIKNLQQDYARESIFTLRGWAGLIHSISKEPHLLSHQRIINLNDFLAVNLTLERAWILEENSNLGQPNFKKLKRQSAHPLSNQCLVDALRLCQEVYEEYNFTPFLTSIQNKLKDSTFPSKEIKFQAIFCIDDRECSIRRHLESTNSKIETFGTAGHFGIECFFTNDKKLLPRKHCPLPIAPKVLIVEERNIKKKKSLIGENNGSISTFRLMKKLFSPLSGRSSSNVVVNNEHSEILLERTSEESIFTNNHWVKTGYSIEEMADLVFSQLKSIGLTKSLSNLVFIIGHGSTSANNPYFTTYGCGACSGRTGSANAKIFAKIANSQNVRDMLKNKYNFSIPSTTHFIAAVHDTCSDVVTFFRTDLIPNTLVEEFKAFKNNISQACDLNAQERCLQFEKFSHEKFNKNKSIHVLLRSLSYFETRPELGHSDVLMAIVGKRELTQGIDLKRRAFMQSYDPDLDHDGSLLAQILMAIVPVCSGINLDYFFSNVDNLRFGAGSKLPQNVVGNFGMSHGTESDLLYGLPSQMIDQHTPLRLILVVEQNPEIALKVTRCNPLIQEIIHNNWINYYSFDSKSKKYYQFINGAMKEKTLMEISHV
jgi:uncharacterized protein YbcC (UPF0753/DUF2309 family)